MSSADRWCNDCAWPEHCAARMECSRRDAGEVRGADPAPVLVERLDVRSWHDDAGAKFEQAMRKAIADLARPAMRGSS